jgi:hypothetical protein
MGGVHPNARENGQISPLDHRSGCPTRQHRPHLASVLRDGRKSANIYVGLGVIWGIPMYET